MSDSKYSQVENDNNQRLDELANKLSTFRNINQDIGNQAANDSSLIDNIQNSFGQLFLNVKNSSSRLQRSMNAGNNIWRMVGVSLLCFFILYTIYKVF
uniref:Sft1p n=1 Tax=Kluyveromyces lactis TaxID=28985 RepID=O74231_KLULC|nr:Sft1p [Kluyveromyces lactis]